MQIKTFMIPVMCGDAFTDEMNAFLRSKKILHVDQQLVAEGQGAMWCFCVRYVEGEADIPRDRPDYRKELDAATFARFSSMRQVRKKIAEEEGVRAFLVFTDSELADLAKLEEITPATMKKVKGIGDKKIEKYGKFFFTEKPADAESKPSDTENH